ncbi:hypothetical protein F4678DRAFT_472827 [Xylaria arbuscula]|nr:hypothetical protein F4678DRAFT_472827 [Xylaria arbuscula]
MPILDGLRATSLIRTFESTRPGHRRALIVGLMASYSQPHVFSPHGFDLFMYKPVRVGELYDIFMGGPETNLAMLYGSLTEQEKSAYPRLVEDGVLRDDPRSNAIKDELKRRRASTEGTEDEINPALTKLIVKRLPQHHNAAEPFSAASPPSFNLDSIALLASLLAQPFSTAASEPRGDSHRVLHSAYWPFRLYDLRYIFALTGTVATPALPPYPFPMSSRARRRVPATPRVISPSPTPSDRDGGDYLGPVTRSAARRRQTGSVTPQLPIEETLDEDSDPELRRARTRSRSPIKVRKVQSLARVKAKAKIETEPASSPTGNVVNVANGATKSSDGLLAPPSLSAGTSIGWSWRDFSRSPSPLGLIPIHRHFQTLIHKHEVPRKALHVSIGFFVYWLYVTGTQTSSVPPYLMAALIPIASVDFLRHKYASLNRFYVKYLGALMRETEYAGWNGVIFYLLGAWIVLRFFPKDVSVVAVMLLSWCDTAASTFGRLYGRYTPRIRRGKSLAGSTAAFLVGVITAGWFWGVLAPRIGPFPGDDQHPFMFRGVLQLPTVVTNLLGLDESAVLRGPAAIGVMSLWSGLVAAGSEVIDLFGWDDNLTIPVLSGLGIWGFLKIFG